MSRPLPDWQAPQGNFRTGLHVSNSMTGRKDEFVPTKGKQVKWYICGPTVYDSSHLGHARTYLSFDIIRRILENYFGYDVQVCMNITDVDDKIIIHSRKNHLFDAYAHKISTQQEISETTWTEILKAIDEHISLLKGKYDKLEASIQSKQRSEKEAGPERNLAKEKLEAAEALKSDLTASRASITTTEALNPWLLKSKEALSNYLDAKEGASLSHELLNEVTRKHSQYYETEYLEDMKALDIKVPDVLTRVSEYVPEIIEMVQKIIDNGYAYESDGSVYFDVAAFDKAQNHYYAKLVPTAYGNTDLLSEGEGGLSTTGSKKSDNDFALWKASKTGEPTWNSPWGLGRPGWHIECSAMAGKVLGANIDIHAGGCDLKFPHHDNELAQSEAYFGNSQWINYFLHTGHLHIDSLKMSKSLKNFITIRDTLAKHPPRHIRMLFLLQSWDNSMNYQRVDTMKEVITKEKAFQEFFLRVEHVLGERVLNRGEATEHWNARDIEFNQQVVQAQETVHASLKNNFDTAATMMALSEMVTKANIYMEKNNDKKAFLLKKSAVYLTKILRVFGVIPDSVNSEFGYGNAMDSSSASSGADPRQIARPYVTALVEFRKQVRALAKDAGDAKAALLKLTDGLRDDIMPELDVRIADDGEFGFFFADRETLKKEKQERLAAESSQRIAKAQGVLAAREKTLKKWTDASETPSDLILRKYKVTLLTADAELPENNSEGTPLSGSQKKSIKKDWSKQEKLYNEYQAELVKDPLLVTKLQEQIQEQKNIISAAQQ